MPTMRVNSRMRSSYSKTPFDRDYSITESNVIDCNYRLYASIEEGLKQVEQGEVRPMKEVINSIEKIK